MRDCQPPVKQQDSLAPLTVHLHRGLLVGCWVAFSALLLNGAALAGESQSDPATSAPHSSAITAAASELPPADADVIAQEAHPFGHAELSQLARDGQIAIEGDRGQLLQVQLLATRNTPRGEVLDISVDGLPGTITRRGKAFFASLPSRTGSLRLENQGQSTRLVEERFLDQRNLPGLADFRTPAANPLAPGK